MLSLKNFKISKFKIKEKVLLYICQTIFFRKNDKTFDTTLEIKKDNETCK